MTDRTDMVNGTDFRNISNTEINNVLDNISANSDDFIKIINDSMNGFDPEMKEQAKKIATSGQGANIIKEMQKRGMNPHSMRAQMKAHKKNMSLTENQGSKQKKAILITSSRQLRVRSVPENFTERDAASIIECEKPLEISCSRLATGLLLGKTIKAWYNPEIRGKNRRASKIVGFAIAGDLLIIMNEGDLDEHRFLQSEKLLA